MFTSILGRAFTSKLRRATASTSCRRRGHHAADLQQHCPEPSGRGRPINDMGAKGGQRSTTPGKAEAVGSIWVRVFTRNSAVPWLLLRPLPGGFLQTYVLCRTCGRGPTSGHRPHPRLGKRFRQKFARSGQKFSSKSPMKSGVGQRSFGAEDLGVLREQKGFRGVSGALGGHPCLLIPISYGLFARGIAAPLSFHRYNLGRLLCWLVHSFRAISGFSLVDYFVTRLHRVGLVSADLRARMTCGTPARRMLRSSVRQSRSRRCGTLATRAQNHVQATDLDDISRMATSSPSSLNCPWTCRFEMISRD